MVIRVLVMGLLAAVVATGVVARNWTDKTGNYSVEADFVGFGNGKVQLKKTDGRIVQVPINILSAEDQKWVRAELRRQKDSGTPSGSSLTSTAASSASGDWPTWRGPKRDGISEETGLLSKWPGEGPELLWSSRGLGRGYSSVSIVGERIYTMGRKGGGVMLICTNRNNGSVEWETRVGGGEDPNCTPTVDPDTNLVYGISHSGDLLCCDAESGQEVWRKNFANDFGGQMMSQWGYSESPLIDGDVLVCTPGSNRAVLAGLNKRTGQVLWQTQMQNGTAGYASPVISNAGGVKQYITLVGAGVIGVHAGTGELMWHYPRVANSTANVPTPIVDGNYVFCSSGYNDGGSALLELGKRGRSVQYREVYYKNNRELQNHHGGMVLIDGRIYMGHGHNQGFPRCVDMRTGRTLWGDGQRGPGTGSAAIVAADGQLYFRYENGIMALIEATPSGYNLNGEFRIASVNGKAWAHPVIAGKKLYLRDQDELHCYDISDS